MLARSWKAATERVVQDIASIERNNRDVGQHWAEDVVTFTPSRLGADNPLPPGPRYIAKFSGPMLGMVFDAPQYEASLPNRGSV